MPASRGGGQVKGGVALGSDAPLGDGRRRLSRNAYVADFLRITSPLKPRPSNFSIFFTPVAQTEACKKFIRSTMALRRLPNRARQGFGAPSTWGRARPTWPV